MNQILILTGEIGSGKTSFCLELAAAALKRERVTGGLVSPGVFSGKEKRAIDVLDLGSSQRKRLAERKEAGSSDLETRRWAFLPQAVEWGNRKLLEAVPCDLLLIDELGPLEFNRGRGWVNAFPVIEGGRYQAALVVVRPSLLEDALARWPGAGVIDLSAPGPHPAPGELAWELLPD